MSEKAKAHVFLVDDDSCIRETVCAILFNARYECTCFSDAESCLKQLTAANCDLLITDVKMPGMNGIELLMEAMRLIPWLPVIVMTSYADIPMSVQAVKAGAFDFVEKPLDTEELLSIAQRAIKQADLDNPLLGKTLTKTEKLVLRLILQGMSNKRIAYLLKRSERTVEVHRSHIMQKLDADNVVELVKRAIAMGFENLK